MLYYTLQAVIRFDDVLDLVMRSEIRDGMTMIAVLYVALLRAQGHIPQAR